MKETEELLDVIGAFKQAVEPLGFKIENIWINEPDYPELKTASGADTDDKKNLRISVSRKGVYL